MKTKIHHLGKTNTGVFLEYENAVYFHDLLNDSFTGTIKSMKKV